MAYQMASNRHHQQYLTTNMSTNMSHSRGVGITSLSPKQVVTAAPVTPTSTPPIRVTSARRGDGISPSPLTTEDQKRYYESSTWRMYDRIQASRPVNSRQEHPQLLPPMNSLTSMLTRSSMSGVPRYPPKQMSRGLKEDDALDQEMPTVIQSDGDDDLIFDLEL